MANQEVPPSNVVADIQSDLDVVVVNVGAVPDGHLKLAGHVTELLPFMVITMYMVVITPLGGGLVIVILVMAPVIDMPNTFDIPTSRVMAPDGLPRLFTAIFMLANCPNLPIILPAMLPTVAVMLLDVVPADCT